MRVFYLSPIVGTGTQLDPFRAKVADYNVDQAAAAIPSKPDGTPKRAWTIVAVELTTETAALRADAALRRIPPGKMTTLVTDLTAAQQNAIQTFLSNNGITAEVGLVPSDTVRDLVRKLATVLLIEVASEWAQE